jgi:hypothetical protein
MAFSQAMVDNFKEAFACFDAQGHGILNILTIFLYLLSLFFSRLHAIRSFVFFSLHIVRMSHCKVSSTPRTLGA